jgi:hypothetical protein
MFKGPGCGASLVDSDPRHSCRVPSPRIGVHVNPEPEAFLRELGDALEGEGNCYRYAHLEIQ